MTTNLQQLFRHDLWANRLILDACAGLTPDQMDATVVGTYGSVGRTLFHLIASIDSCAARLAVRPRLLVDDDAVPVPSNGHLHAILESVGPELIELAGSTGEIDTVEVMQPDGPIAVPGWIILVQAIDHGREHRTHIATILTQLGIEPPDMDGWTFMSAPDPA
ncbi:MAG: DinB family protein [Chloroflexi bacterium]|nr:DinB family protein [Chloroflexota bacterium]